MRALLVVLLMACNPGDPCAEVSDLAGSGLEVTETHPGWGRDQCFQCHTVLTIHRHDCFGAADVDVVEIDDRVDPQDTTTCIACHGTNGVAEWGEQGDTGGGR